MFLIGGTIKNVNLAANTTLSGGNLQGDVVGDNSELVLLENVTIKSGSSIAGVKLGEGVIVEDNVICGEDVQAPEGVCQPPPPPPSPLGVTATDKDGKEVPTNAAILQGSGIAIEDGVFEITAAPTLADKVTIKGQIQVDTAQVGQAGDVVVYVEYTPLGADKPVYVMLNDQGEPVDWDNKPAHLVPFQTIPKLDEQPLTVLMYQGKLPVTGTLKIWFGYQLADGLVVHNLKPIEVNIDK